MSSKHLKILVRGAGDIASGIIWNLAYAGFSVCATEVENPSTIRTEVAFSSAVYEGKKTIDGVTCELLGGIKATKCIDTMSGDEIKNKISDIWDRRNVALVIDSEVKIINEIKFDVVVDAILAKKNLGTKIDMAPLVIGVGPGFTANVDCHLAIETMRGHNLARIIEVGSPMENTGVPGLIAGHSDDRVIHSPANGVIHNLHKIGDLVKKDEVIAVVGEGSKCTASTKVHTSIDGILRGIIRDGFNVTEGLKIADIDPRLSEYENCFTISDKARSIGGAVVVAILNKK